MSQVEAMNMDDFMFQDNSMNQFNTDTRPNEDFGYSNTLDFNDGGDEVRAQSDPFMESGGIQMST